jgi:DNA polymerase family A
MRHVIFDLETNDLLPRLTTLHSLVLRDVETDEVMSCTDSAPGYKSIAEGLAVLKQAERVYGHNIIGFDIPALKKLYPDYTITAPAMDTLVICAMRWAHIKDTDFALFRQGKLPGNMIGRHSLEAWGYRLGLRKGECTDYSTWTPEMQSYCEQDTAVTRRLVIRIRKSKPSKEAIETELALAEYLFKQEQNGWPFDIEKAQELQGVLAAKRQTLDVELRTLFEPWQVSLGMFTPKVNLPARGYVKGVPIERFKTIEFNPGSRDHIANRLTALYGWKPTTFTNSGKPEVDENTLKGLDYEPVAKLRDYLLISKRLGQLAEGKEAWLTCAKLDERTGMQHIYGRVKQSGCVTHRASHLNPNIAQVPKVQSPYGPECRELFRVPEGWVQIGADASGLELRCLAHYMAKYDDGAYGKLVLADKPNDIHTANANVLGVSRDVGKTWFYAFLYGAGDEKLGKILKPGASAAVQKKLGAKARKKFLKDVRALGLLVDDIKDKSSSKGYLNLIDGRRTYIRSEHAALNSLLQGTGAVICKRWIVEFDRALTYSLGPQGWSGQWAALGWIHDEVQIAVRPTVSHIVQATLVSEIKLLTKHFNFRIPLDGEAKIGANWSICH